MSLAHPSWLAGLLVLPLLVVVGMLAARSRSRAWRVLVAPRLRRSLLRGRSPVPRWLALAALLAAIACLLGALARPQGDGGTRTEALRGRNVLLAIDLSRSMRVTDVLPSRLDQARTIALELLDALPDDRIGVIGFAGVPFLVAPLTVDHAAVRETIQQLDTEAIPAGGSDLAGAVRMAAQTFRDSGIRDGALVVVSDGEEHGGQITDTASEADHAGLFIFAVAVGTEDGGFVPDLNAPDGKFRDRDGNAVLSRRHDEALRQFATATGGRFVLASSGTAIGPLIDAATRDLERFEIETRQRVVAIELFQWLLLPAVLLLMAAILAGTNWRPFAGRAAASLLAAATPLRAPAAEPATDPATERFARLAEQAHGDTRSRYRLAEGTAALSSGDLHAARTALSAALLSNHRGVQAAAHHNLANCLIEAGWRALAGGEPYPGGDAAAAQLDEHLARRLAEWLVDETPETGASAGLRLFDSVLLSWTDAIRHYDSAVAADPPRDDSLHNRAVAVRLLGRLRQTLEQSANTAQQQLPPPEPQDGGEGGQQPQPGDRPDQQPPDQGAGKGDQPQPRPGEGEHEGERQPPPPDDTGPPGDPHGDNQSERPDRKRPEPGRADESPAQEARRLLRDNADFEHGPLIPGLRREFRRPAKDW
jgi:Ca-activated chloride channel family protein